jgi:hypothetical protein
MRSKWLNYKGKQIFYQDFSGHDLMDSEPIKAELAAVQAIVAKEPEASVLVLSDFSDTYLGKDLMDLLVESSRLTKSHVKKTAVLGVRGIKRFLADTLIRMTGQALSFFDDEEEAKQWLIE